MTKPVRVYENDLQLLDELLLRLTFLEDYYNTQEEKRKKANEHYRRKYHTNKAHRIKKLEQGRDNYMKRKLSIV
jgi:hypothetical protein